MNYRVLEGGNTFLQIVSATESRSTAKDYYVHKCSTFSIYMLYINSSAHFNGVLQLLISHSVCVGVTAVCLCTPVQLEHERF